jgi:hypothetical protein
MAVRGLDAMLAGLEPHLDPVAYVFCSAGEPEPAAVTAALAAFREAEGTSLILPADAARRHGFDPDPRLRRITLRVYSALDGVGLTAAVAQALARNEIACNVVAAFHHDHVFVPEVQAGRALAILEALQREVAMEVGLG